MFEADSVSDLTPEPQESVGGAATSSHARETAEVEFVQALRALELELPEAVYRDFAEKTRAYIAALAAAAAREQALREAMSSVEAELRDRASTVDSQGHPDPPLGVLTLIEMADYLAAALAVGGEQPQQESGR